MVVYTPKDWGPHGWKFIHFVTLGYPDNPSDEDKLNYKKFLTSIKNILPCSFCSNHYKQNLIDNPLDNNALSSRINLINWGIKVHNAVNKSNGKKEYSLEEGLEIIKNNQDTHTNNNCIWTILIINIILFSLYYFYKKYK